MVPQTSDWAPEAGREGWQPDGGTPAPAGAQPAHRPGESEVPGALVVHPARPEATDSPGRPDEANLVARQAPIDVGSPPGGSDFSHVFSTPPQAYLDDPPVTGHFRIDVAGPTAGPEFAQALSTTPRPEGEEDLLASAGPDEPGVEVVPAGELAPGWLTRDLAAVDQSLQAFLAAFNSVGERLESLLGSAYPDWWYAACGAGLSAAALALYAMRRGRDERDRGQDGALAWPYLLAPSEEVV